MSMKKFRIKKNDQVVVITGSDKGKIGTVLKVLKEDNALLVEGVKMVKRHVKPTQQNAGGIIQKESPIHISNVAILDPKNSCPTKVRVDVLENGEKVRIAKKSGMTI